MDNKIIKIGVLTFHKAINYGSILQAWALQNVLKNNGYYAEIIDYEPKEIKHLYETSIKDARGLKRIVKRMLSFRKSVDFQRKKFDDFKKNYLSISNNQYYFDSDFSSISDEYDIIITGSDQVWNTNIADCDPVFFLPFPFTGKKIAYACSVNDGCVNERFKKEWLRQWLNKYSFISVREKSGTNKIANFLNNEKRIYNTLDPTLLLDESAYRMLLKDRIVQGKYIFLYNMWTKTEGLKAAKFISQKLDLPVYTLTNQMDLIRISKYSVKGIKVDLRNTGPKDFLTLIYYAEFVLTDSFHGTAFSIIFNKQFFSLNSHVNRENYKNDERLMSILNYESLNDRFVKLEDIYDFDLRKQIDYRKVNQYISELKAQSIELLLGAIEGNIQS